MHGIPWKGLPSNSRATKAAEEPYFVSTQGNRLLTAALQRYVRLPARVLLCHLFAFVASFPSFVASDSAGSGVFGFVSEPGGLGTCRAAWTGDAGG